jgi:sec-independent protein translocase protein TatB
MFDIGATELLVIAIVAIVVVGPRELPRLLRTVGNMVSKAKGLAREFQDQFEEAAKDAGVDDLRKDFDEITDLDMAEDFGDPFEPIKNAGEDLKDAVEKPVVDKPAKKAGSKAKAKKSGSPKSKTSKPKAAKPKPKDSADTAPQAS